MDPSEHQCDVVGGGGGPAGAAAALRGDPDVALTMADYEAQFEAAMMKVHDLSSAANEFRRDAVVEAAGFFPRTVGEDMELVVRLHKISRSRRESCRIVKSPAGFPKAPAAS